MLKRLPLLLLFFAFLGILLNTADAARFGGGRSFGAQRSISSFSRPAQPGRMYQNTAAPRSSWAAPLAGLALGGLLGYLFMGHGFGTGILSWLLLFGLGFMIWSFLRGKLQPAWQTGQQKRADGGRVFEAQSYFSRTQDSTSENPVPVYPAGFDSEAFLRDAKVQFIRLQAAYDSKDLKDLREFTAPEVFAEIQLQLQERGDHANHTEVVSLNADLLDVSTENQATMATVKFSGVIREGRSAPSSFFEEAWHFRKDDRSKWIVAGVQQTLN